MATRAPSPGARHPRGVVSPQWGSGAQRQQSRSSTPERDRWLRSRQRMGGRVHPRAEPLEGAARRFETPPSGGAPWYYDCDPVHRIASEPKPDAASTQSVETAGQPVVREHDTSAQQPVTQENGCSTALQPGGVADAPQSRESVSSCELKGEAQQSPRGTGSDLRAELYRAAEVPLHTRVQCLSLCCSGIPGEAVSHSPW